MRKRILTKDVEIARELEHHINVERMREGTRLSSERELAEKFGVQRDTIRSALEILLNKGVLTRKPRHGYFVVPRRIEFDLNNFRSMKHAIEQTGRESKAVLLSFEIISLNRKLAEDTLLPEGTLCYRIVRLRYENDLPMALERSYLVAEHVEGLSEEDVHLKSLSSTLRKKYGIWLANSKQKITAVYATDMEAELLRVKKDEPLMRYEGLVYDRRGRLIEFFNNILLLDCAEFRIREFV